MRSKLLGLVLGCSVLAVSVAPAFACAFHDQQASSDAQQQTAQAQTQQPSQTETR